MCLVRDGGRWDDWPDYLSVLSGAREVTLPIRITDADVELLRDSMPHLDEQRQATRPRNGIGRPPRFVTEGTLFFVYNNKYGRDILLRDFTCRQSIRVGLRFSFRSPPSPPLNGVYLSVMRFLANQARPLTPTYAAQLERPPALTQYGAAASESMPFVFVLREGFDGPPCVVSLRKEFRISPPTGASSALDMVMTSLISPQQWQGSRVDTPREVDRDHLPFVTPTTMVAHAGAVPDGVERIASPDGAGASVAAVLSFIGEQLNTNGRRLVHRGVTDLLTFVDQLGGGFPEDNVTVEKCFLLYRPEAIQ
ncbi:unnamed protein product [Vitrella brassicaformis CCMP3155]|uniref:Uncharacterized protein n=1 Tax=Vitrella brassicaformis (strain CCMP3155) TaxID=1169540 RepID=A0A0G4GED2_VITBC|nr:unnamed protein product [Vitrella brassicaformis CCMP3155]|eukprot:CEM27750.1 unnamed protein product [Vitrella brassicaformis CCMP3155]